MSQKEKLSLFLVPIFWGREGVSFFFSSSLGKREGQVGIRLQIDKF